MDRKINPYRETPFNFLGIEDTNFEEAQVIILPIPYDATSSYGQGARNGPHAIIAASRHLETYIPEINKDPTERTMIHTLPGIEPDLGSAENSIKRFAEVTENILKHNKFLVTIGGDHSITAGVILPFAKRYKNLTVLHIDAHLDLRDEFCSTKYSHACAMRRVRDAGCKTVHIGIRMPGQDEIEYAKEKNIPVFYAPYQPSMLKEILRQCTENVYLSIDLDGLDPSIMPSTGTPVPGGLYWDEIIEIIQAIAKEKNIVGGDIIELAPIPGLTAPDFLAANLVYKIIGFKTARN